jgi:hypothetical protein
MWVRAGSIRMVVQVRAPRWEGVDRGVVAVSRQCNSRMPALTGPPIEGVFGKLLSEVGRFRAKQSLL